MCTLKYFDKCYISDCKFKSASTLKLTQSTTKPSPLKLNLNFIIVLLKVLRIPNRIAFLIQESNRLEENTFYLLFHRSKTNVFEPSEFC